MNTQPLVQAMIISLASNQQPDYHLTFANHKLAKWGELTVSPVLVNQALVDNQSSLSKQTTPIIYHNQMALLRLNVADSYINLLKASKIIEQNANRQLFAKPTVTLDIDIIAIAITECVGTKQKLPDGKLLDGKLLDDKLLDDKEQPMIPLSQLIQEYQYLKKIKLTDMLDLPLAQWYAITRRFPLADYEVKGLQKLIEKAGLQF